MKKIRPLSVVAQDPYFLNMFEGLALLNDFRWRTTDELLTQLVSDGCNFKEWCNACKIEIDAKYLEP